MERIADLLEIAQENSFKIRAYRLAAVQAENLGQPLTEIAKEEKGLRGVEGFGEAIASKVQELLDTGRSEYMTKLESEVPPSLLEIRMLPTVGPKTAAMLWKDAGITTLEQLDAAAREGKLVGLPHMGDKTIAKIIEALDRRKAEGNLHRHKRSEVEPLVEEVLDLLEKSPHTKLVEVAGSFRRNSYTVGDLDFVVATTTPREVLERFSKQAGVEKVIALGDTKCSVWRSGIQMDCRAVEPDSFGAALLYFTGSQAHNIRMRGRALKQGMVLNEYGLYQGDDRVAGSTEQEVYKSLGLNYITPEERIDAGELERYALESEESPAP